MVVVNRTMKIQLLSLILLFTTGFCLAQSPADTMKISPLRTISLEQYKAYMDGVDINNMATVAELNHYPNPQKTIDWKKELILTADQLKQITAINVELTRKMKEMGGLMIKNETVVDELFRSKKPDDGNLIFYTNRYGLYQGEMRNAILQAYVKVRNILNFTQRLKYNELQKLHH